MFKYNKVRIKTNGNFNSEIHFSTALSTSYDYFLIRLIFLLLQKIKIT